MPPSDILLAQLACIHSSHAATYRVENSAQVLSCQLKFVQSSFRFCIFRQYTYLKKSRLLKFYYVPSTSSASSEGIFAAATNSTNQTNKAGSMCHLLKYHCTIDLLFHRFGISCMIPDNFRFYLQNRLIQTSQTGGQQYSDTSPFSIPYFGTTIN